MDDYSNIVTWLLVISGWLIVNRQQNQREDRKEIRRSLDNIKLMCDDIYTKAVKYHVHNSAHDPSLSSELKHLIQVLADEISLVDLLSQVKPLMQFRRSITLDNFDTNSFTSKAIDSELVHKITKTKIDLSQELEKSFVWKYRTPRRRKVWRLIWPG